MQNKIFIVTCLDLKYNTAGKKRLLSYEKMLNEKGIKLIFFSFYNGICYAKDFSEIKSHPKKRSLKNILIFFQFIKNNTLCNGKIKLILYPSSFYFFSIFFIFYFKFQKKYLLYIELNEVRKYTIRFVKLNSIGAVVKNTRSLIDYTMNSFTDLCFKFAKGHIYISHKISNYYKKNQSIIIPIICNSKCQKLEVPKSYQRGNCFYLGFAGSIDFEKEKMESLFKTIQKMNDYEFNIKINLYGKIYNQNKFDVVLKNIGFDNTFLKYFGEINQDVLLKKLREENHLMILPRGFSKQNYYGFSTKLGEYLETNLPIITTLIGDAGIYFIDGKNCFTYNQEKMESLESKLIYILNNYDEIVPRITNGGNALINDFLHYSNHSCAFVKFLND